MTQTSIFGPFFATMFLTVVRGRIPSRKRPWAIDGGTWIRRDVPVVILELRA